MSVILFDLKFGISDVKWKSIVLTFSLQIALS